MKYVIAVLVNLTFVSNAWAMSGQSGGKEGGGSIVGLLLPMVIVFAIFYLLLIRPQQKQQKKMKEMLGAIQKGDDVVTRGGIHGKITGIADNILTLEIADNVKVKIGREFVGVIKGCR